MSTARRTRARPRPRPPATATQAVTGCGQCGRGRHRPRIQVLQHANRPLIVLVQVHRTSRRLGRVRSSSCSLCTQRYRRRCRCCCCRTGRSRSRHASWGVLRIHRQGCPAGSSERPSIGSLQRAVEGHQPLGLNLDEEVVGIYRPCHPHRMPVARDGQCLGRLQHLCMHLHGEDGMWHFSV